MGTDCNYCVSLWLLNYRRLSVESIIFDDYYIRLRGWSLVPVLAWRIDITWWWTSSRNQCRRNSYLAIEERGECRHWRYLQPLYCADVSSDSDRNYTVTYLENRRPFYQTLDRSIVINRMSRFLLVFTENHAHPHPLLASNHWAKVEILVV